MVTDNKATLYSRLAAVCFLLLGIDYLIWWILIVYKDILYEGKFKFIIMSILMCGMYFAFSAVLMSSKKQRGLLIVTVLYTIIFIYINNGYRDLFVIKEIAACAFLFIIILESVKGGRMAEERWAIPGGIIILGFYLDAIKYYTIPQILMNYEAVLITLVKGLGFIFIGLWAKTEAKEHNKKEPTLSRDKYPIDNALENDSNYELSDIDIEEKLKTYKQLLDSGIITREEYDAKRNQLSKQKKF